MELKIKLLRDSSILPKKAHKEDAAFDCFVNSVELLTPNKVKVGLGFAVEVPKGFMLNIVSRSSIGKTNWILANSYGVVDNGYIEEVFAVFECIPSSLSGYYQDVKEGHNVTTFLKHDKFPYMSGERCCQMFLQELIDTDLIIVDNIEGTRSGFGSTKN